MTRITFSYSGGQLYNRPGDYGYNEMKAALPEWIDAIDDQNNIWWKVYSDDDKRAFESAIKTRCPQLKH